jgi:hypothetical protein
MRMWWRSSIRWRSKSTSLLLSAKTKAMRVFYMHLTKMRVFHPSLFSVTRVRVAYLIEAQAGCREGRAELAAERRILIPPPQPGGCVPAAGRSRSRGLQIQRRTAIGISGPLWTARTKRKAERTKFRHRNPLWLTSPYSKSAKKEYSYQLFCYHMMHTMHDMYAHEGRPCSPLRLVGLLHRVARWTPPQTTGRTHDGPYGTSHPHRHRATGCESPLRARRRPVP